VLSLGWGVPFVSNTWAGQVIVEPIVAVDIAPNMGNQAAFPNEDSRGVTLDATNIFSANRFPGYDRVDGGQRVSYGVNSVFNRSRGGQYQFFAGQSLRVEPNTALPTGSGLDQKQSSYVTRVIASPHPWATSILQGQFDPHLETQQINTTVSLGPPDVAVFATTYLFIKASSQQNLTSDVKQIVPQMNVRLTPHWRLQFYDAYDLGVDKGQLLQSTALIYEDECLVLEGDVQKRYIGSVNNPSETLIGIRIVFRNLGEIDTGFSGGTY
jgi:LPS-assembly protein